jgi:hypothetical protein
MRLPRLLAASLCLTVFSGCAGYHLGPVKPSVMQNVRTLAVPSFKNMTLEPRIESQLANALIKQIQQDGSYQIASEKNADAVVYGTIERIERVPVRGLRTDFYRTTEYNLELQLNIRVVEPASGKELLKRSIKGSSSFFVSGSAATASSSSAQDINARIANVNRDEREAIPRAAEDAAVRLTSYLSEGW